MLFVVQLVMKALFVGLATALFSAAGHESAVCSAAERVTAVFVERLVTKIQFLVLLFV